MRGSMEWLPSPWRAWNTFIASLVGAFVALTVAMLIALGLRLTAGELTVEQTRTLLRGLYWGSYPLAAVALGSLTWHVVRTERGDYA